MAIRPKIRANNEIPKIIAGADGCPPKYMPSTESPLPTSPAGRGGGSGAPVEGMVGAMRCVAQNVRHPSKI
jgi:hypothetical protein